jgi:hypothetical protein
MIPIELHQRMMTESGMTNWSLVVTSTIQNYLDRTAHVQESLSVRVSQLEATLDQHLKESK